MKSPKILSVNQSSAISEAIKVLSKDGLIVFPTDTLYGLACSPHSEVALKKIYAAKHRNPTKAIPILIGRIEHLREIVTSIPDEAQSLIDAYWPGKLTLVLPKQKKLSRLLSATDTIAVRMPAHPFAQALLQSSSPLAVTSANLSDHKNHAFPEEILSELGEDIGLFIDGGKLESTIPSTIVDCSVQPPKVLREGAISKEDIQALISQKSA